MSGIPTIYLCDDDDGVRSALSFLLRQHDLQVSAHASGPELLARVDTSPVPVRGVFILDLRMEPMSGQVVHDQLRARGLGLRCPVIFLSGHGDIPVAVKEMQKGAFEFVEKPYTDDALVGLIQRALAKEESLWSKAERCRALGLLLASLSKQQRRIVPMVEKGELNKVMAWKLDLSERAIEVHKAKLFDKLSVRSAAEVATIVAEMRACGLVIDEGVDSGP
jgi:two-component system, LuxR family, response regulator DctR